MRIFLSILLIISITSCKLSKQQRIANRKSKKIERIAEKYDLKTIDTAKAVIQYISNPVRIDTLFELETVYLDTLGVVTILPPKKISYQKGNLSVELLRIDKGKGFWYRISAQHDPDTVYIDVEVPYEVIQPKEYVKVPIELTKWQRFIMGLGKGTFWVLIIALILLILRQVIKTYNPFSWLQ